jgi:hypothetical protein
MRKRLSAKETKARADMIMAFRDQGMNYKDIGKQFGMTDVAVSAAVYAALGKRELANKRRAEGIQVERGPARTLRMNARIAEGATEDELCAEFRVGLSWARKLIKEKRPTLPAPVYRPLQYTEEVRNAIADAVTTLDRGHVPSIEVIRARWADIEDEARDKQWKQSRKLAA